MRRLALLFVALAAANTIEHVALASKFDGWESICEAPRRMGRALMSLSDWRSFLIGRLRLGS